MFFGLTSDEEGENPAGRTSERALVALEFSPGKIDKVYHNQTE